MTKNAISSPNKIAVKRKNWHVHGLYTEAEVISIIKAENKAGKSLRMIAANLYGGKVRHSVIQRALKGELPKDPEIRAIMGLGALVPAPACPVCGSVPLKKYCDHGRGASKKGPRRVAINTEDMRSAYRTIKNNLCKTPEGREKVTKLIGYLQTYLEKHIGDTENESEKARERDF